MDAINWLFAANAIIWLGLGCYAAFLGFSQRNISRRLKQMELMRNDSGN